MNSAVVSVITGAYNCSAYIGETYDSLCRQTLSDWEWIVVDDASTDATPGILNGIAKNDARVRILVNERNLGAAGSRNRALGEASGQFLAFLDADDRWLPEKLMRQLDFMRSESAAASFTAYRVIASDGTSTGKIIDESPRQKISYAEALRKRATIGCSTVMISKSASGNHLMPDIRTGQDYAYWLKLMRSGVLFHHLAVPLTDYRITPMSISRNKVRKAMRQWEIYRKIEGLGFMYAAWNFCFYAIRAVVVKCR
jgi:teichuronic acid biosynthesis glycosyltransferase TuaG